MLTDGRTDGKTVSIMPPAAYC